MYLTLNIGIGPLPTESRFTELIRKELLDYTVMGNKNALVVENAPAPACTINFMVYPDKESTEASAAIIVENDLDSENKMLALISSAFRAGASSLYIFSEGVDMFVFARKPEMIADGVAEVRVDFYPMGEDVGVFETDGLVLHTAKW